MYLFGLSYFILAPLLPATGPHKWFRFFLLVLNFRAPGNQPAGLISTDRDKLEES